MEALTKTVIPRSSSTSSFEFVTSDDDKEFEFVSAPSEEIKETGFAPLKKLEIHDQLTKYAVDDVDSANKKYKKKKSKDAWQLLTLTTQTTKTEIKTDAVPVALSTELENSSANDQKRAKKPVKEPLPQYDFNQYAPCSFRQKHETFCKCSLPGCWRCVRSSKMLSTFIMASSLMKLRETRLELLLDPTTDDSFATVRFRALFKSHLEEEIRRREAADGESYEELSRRHCFY